MRPNVLIAVILFLVASGSIPIGSQEASRGNVTASATPESDGGDEKLSVTVQNDNDYVVAVRVAVQATCTNGSERLPTENKTLEFNYVQAHKSSDRWVDDCFNGHWNVGSVRIISIKQK